MKDKKPNQSDLEPSPDAENPNLKLREKIRQMEIQKIKRLTIADVLTKKRQPKPDDTHVSRPDDLISVARTLNQNFDVHEGIKSEKTPGEMWAKQIMQRERLKKIYEKELNKYPILHQVKRGKLAFAFTASLMLPAYFYFKNKVNRQKVIRTRGISPQEIQNLTEDSPIDLDAVSHHTYHYRNKERDAEMTKHLENVNIISKLQKDLDEML